MKAFMLCAGKSTRTHPLTVDLPKPLLKVMNKTILERNLDALQDLVKEVVLVVGFRKELIRRAARDYRAKNRGMRISTVEQKQAKGTGDAVAAFSRKAKAKEGFLLLMGDNIYTRQDLSRLLKKKDAILSQKVEHPENFGVLLTRMTKGKRLLKGIQEKPKRPKGRLINAGAYVFQQGIFDHLKKVRRSPRGEYEFTDAITAYAKETPVEVVEAKEVQHISHPWDLLTINELLIRRMKQSEIRGKVEKHAVIKGPVHIGKGSIIRGGVHIEGPVVIGEHCSIGPNCYLRAGTTIGDHCKVGNATEIKNSIFFDHVSAGHLSYVGDSVIGAHTNLGAGTITANLRHDDQGIRSMVRGKLADTHRRKLGAIIGDHVHTGIHTSILPGRKIWPGKGTRPGEVVDKDVV
ncbi:MAG: NTP transferase domain-containing protein [DPANN group archaeon]|nr:NTP transferase domain-containing protein [DPANN group archaeon]